MAHSAPAATPAPSVTELTRLALLGALVGLPIGLVAFGLISAVHALETWLWDDLPHALGTTAPPWYLVVGLPVVGAVLVYLARLLPGDGGESPLHGQSIAAPASPPIDVLSVLLAALATLPFGAVLGPEAPLIGMGLILGRWLTSWARVSPFGRAMLGLAGSGAAMSTLFGGPLVAGMMILEGAAGSGVPILAVMIPVLSSAAVAYTLITGLGSWSGLPMAGMAVPSLPVYGSVLVVDLLIAVAVGIVTAGVVALIRYGAHAVAGQERRIGRLPLLVAAGLAVGLLGLLARGLGMNSQDVLFSGQASIGAVIATVSVGPLLVLLVAKAVAFSISLGSGFRGGPIFPAVFTGVAIAQIAVIAFGTSPTVAIAMGTAAGMAAMSRMLVAPVLFAFMLTSSAGLDAILVATIASVTSRLVAEWLGQRFPEPALEEPAVSRPE